MKNISRNVYSLPVSGKPKIMPSPFHEEHTRHALDFFATPGSPVFAAFDGIVMNGKDSYRRGGAELKYLSHYNFILIKHKFGEYSHYVHLQNKSLLVRPGQRVVAGQIIARTGETGFTSYPHLHFDIFRYDKDENIISLKQRILSDKGEVVLENPNRFIDKIVDRAYWFVKNGKFSIMRRNGAIVAFSLKILADDFIVFNQKKNARSFYLTEEESVLMLKKISRKLLVDEKNIIEL